MKKPALDFETQLHTVPVRNARLKIEVSGRDPDVLLVGVELVYHGLTAWLASLLQARRHKRYELSGLARELFEQIDGTRSLEDLIEQLMAQDDLSFLEARGLMVHYLRDLMQRGLVVILPDTPLADREKQDQDERMTL